MKNLKPITFLIIGLVAVTIGAFMKILKIDGFTLVIAVGLLSEFAALVIFLLKRKQEKVSS